MSKPIKGSTELKWLLLTASAPAVWGTTYIVTSTLLPDASPWWSSVFRALPAGLIGLAICRELPHGSWVWKSFVMSLLNMGIFFPMLFISAYRLPGGVAAVLSACQPIFTALIAWLVLKDGFDVRRICFGLVGIVGIALMVLDPNATVDILGIVAGIIGTASMAAGIVFTKKWGRPTGGLSWASWLLLWAGVQLTPIAIIFEGEPPNLDMDSILGYGWLAVVGALLTYWAWFEGLSKLSAGSASFLPLLSPIVATILGTVILREYIGPVQWLGLFLCLSAIFLAQIPIGKLWRIRKTKEDLTASNDTSNEPRTENAK